MPRSFGWVDIYDFVQPKKKSFLLAYSTGLTIGEAADKAGIGRQSHYDWMNHEHDEREMYHQAFEDAKERRFEILEKEARRRAVEGVENPIFDKDGNLVGHEIKYSDTLLIFLMKGSHPEIYRDNMKIDVNGTVTLESLLTLTEQPK